MAGFEGPIHLHLRPSARLRAAVCALHGLACLVVALAYPPSAVQFALLCALVADAWRCERSAARPRPEDVTTVSLDSHDAWQLWTRAERPSAARLLRATHLTAAAAALDFDCADGRVRHVLLLAGETVDADAFRRLRVRLQRIGARETRQPR